MTVVSFRSGGRGCSVKAAGHMSPTTAATVRKFVTQNADNYRSSHGPMTGELLVTILL
jgi:hypothetical protein